MKRGESLPGSNPKSLIKLRMPLRRKLTNSGQRLMPKLARLQMRQRQTLKEDSRVLRQMLEKPSGKQRQRLVMVILKMHLMRSTRLCRRHSKRLRRL